MVLFFGAVSDTLYKCNARAASLLGRGGVTGEGTYRVGSLSSFQTLKPETSQTEHLIDADSKVKCQSRVVCQLLLRGNYFCGLSPKTKLT